MSSAALANQGVTLPAGSIFPEREDPPDALLDRFTAKLLGIALRTAPRLATRRLSAIVAPCRTREAALGDLDDQGLLLHVRELRARLHKASFDRRTLLPVFAAVSETATRSLGVRPHDGQLMAAVALLSGQIVELGPGEGKTLAAAIAAAAAALTGVPVHVVAAEDEAARRAAEELSPLYRSLGLTLGLATGKEDVAARRAAHRSDVTYTACQTLALDHLRDRMSLGRHAGNIRLKLERLYRKAPRCDELLLRGLHLAILDDADEILLDRAGDSLVVSDETDPKDERRRAEEALEMVLELEPDRDFLVLSGQPGVELSDAGRARLAERADAMGGIWRSRSWREASACLALTAFHLFQSGQQYQVRDGVVEISDEAARSLDRQDGAGGVGLKQLLEAKEGCDATGRRVALARTTLPRVFRRYHHLCGLTATARHAAAAFWSEYRLPFAVVADGWSNIRRRVEYVLPTQALQRRAVVLRAQALQAADHAVVIGVASPDSANAVSQSFEKAGVSATSLCGQERAARDELIAGAGEAGRITVATLADLAGREIPQGFGSAANVSGLHIILAERHALRRLDRRLEGYTGRRGTPGRVEVLVSLGDPVLQATKGSVILALAGLPAWPGQVFGRLAFRRAQQRLEAMEARKRRHMAKADRRKEQILAFTGGAE